MPKKKNLAQSELRSKELLELMNVGKAVHRDLLRLGITSVEQLAQANPNDLYMRLEKITQAHQDPCAWDVLAAIVHEAQTGEKMPWWHWTPIRKKEQIISLICVHARK